MSIREREVTALVRDILDQPVVSRPDAELADAVDEWETIMRAGLEKVRPGRAGNAPT